MSRTIKELSQGQIVYLDETVSGTKREVPYIYLGLDEAGNARLLRKYVASQRRMHPSNVAMYNGCEADVWLENETSGFLSRFDEVTRMCFVATPIKSLIYDTGEITELARRCFLLSYSEYGYASTPNEGKSYLEAMKVGMGTTNANNARIGYTEAGATVVTWLRSPCSASQFRNSYTNGLASNYDASLSVWCRPALSVSADTIVSSESEETIYLLPDPSKNYREIDAKIYMGSREEIPKSVRCMVETTNCSMFEMYVTVNYKDDDVVWTQVENGVAIDTSSMHAVSGCELGVKLYARSNGKAIITEPVMIVG